MKKHILKIVSIIKNEGFDVFLAKVKNIASRKLMQRKRRLECFLKAIGKDVSVATINKYDVIFFSIINWDFRYQRPQHLAVKFAKNGHRVFYLNINLAKRDSYKCAQISDKIFEVTIPFITDAVIYDINIAEGFDVVIAAFNELFKKFSIKELIAFVELPSWLPVVEFLKNKYGTKVVFDCLDEYSGFSNISKDNHAAETRLAEIADYCVATSDLLYQKHKDACKEIALIRNAAEFNHFSHCPENTLLGNVRKPIIGYYGAINDRFDVEIVQHVAATKPGWSIVLIGSAGGDIKKGLKAYPNIYLLGEVTYSILPQYLYWFDVCIIPFKLIPLTLSTNPVKFYEFMSAGKPVVACELPELLSYKDYVYVAKNKLDFVAQIDKALVEDNDILRKARVGLAMQNDWHHRFQEVDKIAHDLYPLVSIIIITYNNLQYNKLCIESIYAKTAYPNFELIIIDNASSDGTVGYLQEIAMQHNNIKLILNQENKGFAGANNIGIKEAKGEFIILLNNDTIVTRGWISGLLKYLSDPTIGMVGPVTSWAGNEARVDVTYSKPVGIEIFAEYYTQKHRNEIFDIPMLAMFCVALRKDTVEKVGLLDEQFGVGMFEDDDYSYRVRQAGLRIVCAEDVFIHHFGRLSFSKIDQEKYQKIFDENREKYEQKWGIKWVPHKSRINV